MERIPVYLSTFNRLTFTRRMVEAAVKLDGADVLLIDNASTYPPLLEWYRTECPCPVLQLPVNHGWRVAWSGVIDLPKTGYYVVSDADLGLDGVPPDLLSLLRWGLDRYPDVCKAGPNERIDDLPEDSPIRDHVVRRIGPYWERRRDAHFWDGDIDTTFAMYRAGAPPCVYGPAIRAGHPYAVRHLSWYLTPGNVPEDEVYYMRSMKSVNTAGLIWSPALAQSLGVG